MPTRPDAGRLRHWLASTLAAVIAAGALMACKGSLPPYDYSTEPNPITSEYVLGISDAIEITVWKNGDLSTKATIRPDGTITMPLIGDLQAVGKTPTDLKAEIETKLGNYIKLDGTPITVAVTSANSYRFIVGGEVNGPGVFTSSYYVTVVEAIALAGGFTRFANKNRLTLLRRDAKTKAVRAIPLDYDLIVSGKRPEMNLVLISGDSLNIP